MVDIVAYDVETTGLRLHDGAEMFGWSTCDEQGFTDVFRLDDSVLFKSDIDGLRLLVGKWVRRCGFGNVIPVMHNAKFDLTATENRLGTQIAGKVRFHCTYIQSHIVRNDLTSRRLKDLAYVYGAIPMDDEAEVKRYVKASGTDYSGVPEDVMGRYQALDAYRAMLLHKLFFPMIVANPKWLEIYESELKTVVVTMRMQERGIVVRRTACEALIAQLERQVDEVLEQAADLVGKPVSLAGDELIWLLFQHFKIPILNRTPKEQRPAVDKETFRQIKLQEGDRFPILDLVLQYRSWTHGASILKSYLAFADEEGTIHPSINTCKAVTGRQSCSEPNLHSVSKTEVVLNPYPVPSRRIFRPRIGYVNFHIDFSGQELRVLIHYCLIYVGKDKVLWAVLENNTDLHYPACKIFFPDYDQMPPSLQKSTRDAVKNTNFAGAYGAGDSKMCRTAGLPEEIGIPRVHLWRETFPALAQLSRVISRKTVRNGWVETCFGRRLYLRKRHAAVNTLVQGTGAEILKRAENVAFDYLEAATGGEMRQILPIHDEIIIECPRSRLGDAKPILQELARRMINFPQLKVPLKVDVKVATYSWEKTVPYLGDE